jgi:hypothetical protein
VQLQVSHLGGTNGGTQTAVGWPRCAAMPHMSIRGQPSLVHFPMPPASNPHILPGPLPPTSPPPPHHPTQPTPERTLSLSSVPHCRLRFVSEFLVFEPLEDPLQPPHHLPSPLSTLQWQSGDAFDFATVLASLLLGAGFNAFVVLGYAPVALTINDQRQTPCPWITPQQAAQQQAAAAAAAAAAAGGQQQQDGAGKPGRPTTATAEAGAAAGGSGSKDVAPKQGEDAAKKQKYAVRPKPDLESKVAPLLQQQQAPGLTSRSAAAAAAAAAASGGASTSRSSSDTSASGVKDGSGEGGPGAGRPSRRVHAWVLLLPGRREVRREFVGWWGGGGG